MVDWVKVFVNAIITGAITATSTLVISGLNTTAAIVSAVLAGLVSFLVELQKGSQTAGIEPKPASKLTIF